MEIRGSFVTLWLLLGAAVMEAFVVNHQVPSFSLISRKHATTTTTPRITATTLFGKKDDDDESWDDDVDYDDILGDDDDMDKKPSPDPSTNWLDDDNSATPKLGIEIGKRLQPLTPEQAKELKEEATEAINKAFAEGLDEIESMRQDMTDQLARSKKAMDFASELEAQRESEKLMSKIDSLTDNFLSSTKSSRTSTKMAAAADANMKDKGLEMGSWGTIGNAVVTTSGGSGLLGSVNAATSTKQGSSTSTEQQDAGLTSSENSILIVADESSDPVAKQVLTPLTTKLQEAIPDVQVNVIKPTATMPLGADNAPVLVVFATSVSDASGLGNIYSRALRTTLGAGGQVNTPPTQLVCVSTVGTERTDKMPYSMQNLMGGGKLEKRRQMEEVTQNTVQKHMGKPPLDYTICKLGEVKAGGGAFEMAPGDVLDGAISPETAAEVLLQAIAFQPAARNATLCAVGKSDDSISDQEWDDAFLKLEGPELWRLENVSGPKDQLVEYLAEWADLLEGDKRLTTPIRTERSSSTENMYPLVVKERYGVRLLFLPTKTGSAYQSKSEERARERELSQSSTKQTSRASSSPSPKRQKKDGGIEVLVEVTSQQDLRVRARRCNMQDDTVIKELSEETILKRLQEAMDVWKKDHAS